MSETPETCGPCTVNNEAAERITRLSAAEGKPINVSHDPEVCRGGGCKCTHGAPETTTEVPAELIKPAAEVLWRHYDSEFNASHLSWKDFTGEARDILAAVLPAHEAMVRRHFADVIETRFGPVDPETGQVYDKTALEVVRWLRGEQP